MTRRSKARARVVPFKELHWHELEKKRKVNKKRKGGAESGYAVFG